MKLLMDDYVKYIKRQLSGGLLSLEIEDSVIMEYIQDAVTELSRYYDQATLITIPYTRCIDLTGFDHSAIINVYRTEGYGGDASTYEDGGGMVIDPLYMQQ